MTGSSSASFNNFFGNTRQFGLNIKVPTRTLKEAGDTAVRNVTEIANPFVNFLEKNEDVFNGNVETEIRKTQANFFNTSVILSDANEKVNGKAPAFDARF